MNTLRLLAAAAISSLAITASADATQYCPSDASNVCYRVGIPASTAATGSGNIYFSITAPTSYAWVALGSGASMASANIFVMYQDGTGNVTLSPRLGANHVMPTEDTSSTAARLTLLAGSGVSGSTMTANFVCANCESWGTSGSTLSLTSTSAPWIGAWHAGSSLATTSKGAAIAQHDGTVQYRLDLSKATLASDSNPFVEGGADSTGGSDSGSSSSGSSSGSPSSNSGSSSGVTVVASPRASVLTAHAIIMALVMVVLYPLGSALMPLVGQWLLHGVWQGTAYLLMWAGFGLGVVAARQRHLLFASPGRTHTVLGTVVVALMGLQPLLGLLHHRHFVRSQRRGVVSHVHMWYGRILMVLGIVNGGLGLKLAHASHGLVVAYSVVAGVLFAVYIVCAVAGAVWLGPHRRAAAVGAASSASRSEMGPMAQTRARGANSTNNANKDGTNGSSNSQTSASPVLRAMLTDDENPQRRLRQQVRNQR